MKKLLVLLCLVPAAALAQVTPADEALMRDLLVCQRYGASPPPEEVKSVSPYAVRRAMPVINPCDPVTLLCKSYGLAGCDAVAAKWKSTGALDRYTAQKTASDALAAATTRAQDAAQEQLRKARERAEAEMLGK